MAYQLSQRARKLAWSGYDPEKQGHIHTQIRRTGTDSTLGDGDSITAPTSIKRVSLSENLETLSSALETSGCVIIEDFTSLDTLKKAAEETKSWSEAGSTRKPLIQHSPTVRDHFLANKVYQELCEELLTREITKWQHNRRTTEIRAPVLSSASAKRIPGTAHERVISRHDAALGTNHTWTTKYQRGRDSMLGLLVPSSKTVTIHAVLGSHLSGNEMEDLTKDIVKEEVNAGEAVIVLGSLYHFVVDQLDDETTDQSPSTYDLWSCAGVYRPEEQVVIGAEELRTYPEVVQERLR